MKFSIFGFLLLSFIKLQAQTALEYDHEFRGCPINSTCSKTLGELRLSTMKLLESRSYKELNLLKKEKGFLLHVWLKPEIKSQNYISWDSACSYHIKERKFQQALAPLSTLASSQSDKNIEIFYPYIYIQEGTSYRRQIVIKNAQPIFISGKDLYFVEEMEGKYFGLKVSSSGEFEIVETPQIIERSRYLNCPENIKEVTKSENLDLSPYNQFYCKEIWNRESKKYQLLIFPYSCS